MSLEYEDTLHGPTIRYRFRKFWKGPLLKWIPKFFFKGLLHSLFYENAEVVTPGTKAYWNSKEKTEPDSPTV